MASLNKVILIGNIGKDPEIRQLENGYRIAKFSVATHETYKNKDGLKGEQTEWHNVVVLRDGLVEIAKKYVIKGKQVYVEGKIRTRNWIDKEGVKKSLTEIVAENFIMLGNKKPDENIETGYNKNNENNGNEQIPETPKVAEQAETW